MSSYFQSEDEESNQSSDNQNKNLFFTQEYLSGSLQMLNEWKQNTSLEIMQYLQKEGQVLKHQSNLVISAYQVRMVAFCEALLQAFRTVAEEYKKGSENKQAISENIIRNIDSKLLKIVQYLHLAELNNWINFYNDLYPLKIEEIYANLRKCILYCIDLDVLWFALITPKMFRKEQNYDLYKFSLSGNKNFYQKEIVQAKRRYLNHSHCFNICQNPKQLIGNISQIINDEKIKDFNEMKTIFLIKGQYYQKQPPKNLKEHFIRESLKVYNSTELSDSWDFTKYEKLCYEILEKSLKNPDYMTCLLYMEPELCDFKNRRLILEFAEIINQILNEIICLTDKKNQKPVNISFLYQILDNYNFPLFFCLLVNFQASNKEIYSIDNPQMHKTFLEIIEKMKIIYLSFMTDYWVCPISIVQSITIKFFLKFSQDFTSQILVNLPKMIQNLAEDKMPTKILITKTSDSIFSIVQKKVSRLEYLSMIFAYLDDYLTKFPEEYIQLPEIYPTDLYTAILFIRSLELRLKHHNPSSQQAKKSYCEILDTCTNHYKLGCKFNWYKNQDHLCNIGDREVEFIFQREIKSKWAQQLFQDLLNHRDTDKNQAFIRASNNGQLDVMHKIIPYLKYSIGMPFSASRYNTIQETELFYILDEMRLHISMPFKDLFNLPLEQQVSINYVHLCLMFYNTKVQAAKGNQIYQLIVQRIIVPWIKSPSEASELFKKKFSQFFMYHNMESQFMLIGDYIINHIIEHESQENCKDDIIAKIDFFCDAPIKMIGQTPTQTVQELLSKVLSIFNPDLNINVFLPICKMFMYIINGKITLKEQFSLDYALDFIMNEQLLVKIVILMKDKNFSEVLKQSFSHKYRDFLPDLTFKQAQILFNLAESYYQGSLNNADAYKARKDNIAKLVEIPEDPSKYHLWIFKAIMMYINLKKNQNAQDVNEAHIIFDKFLQISKKWDNINKVSLKAILPKNTAQKIRAQQLQIKAQKKQPQTNELIKVTNKFVRIWCDELIKKNGTIQDIIYFKQDIMDHIKSISKDNDIETCTRFIKQNRIKYKSFKKIINKLPVLQKCAEDVIQNIQDPSPQLICKLILIDSKYHSQKLESYILNKLQIFSGLIPIKIYQSYLVQQIKTQLKNIPMDFLEKILYGQNAQQSIHELNNSNIQKANEVFDKILCLPIKKFENIKINKGESNDQNKGKEANNNQGEKKQEDWVTQSEEQSEKNQENIESDKQQNKPEENSLSSSAQEDSAEGDEENNDDNYSDMDQSNKPPIAQLFYEQNESQKLQKYKQFIILREQIDLIVEGNYLQSLEKYRGDLQYKQKMEKIVKILETIGSEQIIEEINLKIPTNLFYQLKHFGYTKEVNNEKWLKQLKQQKKLPKYDEEDNGYISDRFDESDDNYDNDSEEDDYDSQITDEDRSIRSGLSEVGQEKKVAQNLCDDDQITVGLQDLKKINSKIEIELSGQELSAEELTKILEISIFKLFMFTPSQRQLKSILIFYKEILASKFKKIFIDTVLTVVRVDQKYQKNKRYEFLKHLNQMGLSIRKAIDSFVVFCNRSSEESKSVFDQLMEDCGELLPIGNQILLKSDIPVQDNRLTLFILLTKFKKARTYEKIRNLLISLCQLKPYKFTKARAKLLTAHTYQNDAASWIWKLIEETLLNVTIDKNIQIYCCVSVFGKILLEQITKSIDLKKIAKEQSDLPYHYQEKVAQNLLKIYGKKIKHYYYWSKKCLLSIDEESQTKKLKKFLRNKELIKITEFMIFYTREMKIKFHAKSDQKVFNKIISLPEKIIKVSFMYIYLLRKSCQKQNWQSLEKVEKFFQHFSFSQYSFTRLEQICNLLFSLSSIQIFCGPKYKEVMLPFLVQNQQASRSLPLMFKAPRVPQEADGQRIYVTRQCSFDMTLYQLKGKALLVEFHDQEGSDYGGMIRQLMMGWTGIGIGEEGFFIGKILGISFKKSIPYGGDFDLAMAIAITGYKVDMEFLKEHQAHVYESLKFIEDNDPEDLELKFIITKQKYGIIKQYPLKQKGEDIQVNQENKEQYLRLYMQNYYKCGREWELTQVKNGFNTIVYAKYAEIFHPVELIRKVRGEQVSDYMKLKKKAKYQQGYTQNSPIIKWLWEIISKFSQPQMNKFIQFLTGAPKVSLYDPYFSFTVEKTYEDDEARLPVAHTCFNTLDLPQYSTKELLESKLRMAIFQGNDNFGIL